MQRKICTINTNQYKSRIATSILDRQTSKQQSYQGERKGVK